MYSVFLRVNVYLATLLRTYVFDQPFNMFYYIALKYGNFLLETLDTFPLLNDAYTQSRKFMKTGYPLGMVLYIKEGVALRCKIGPTLY